MDFNDLYARVRDRYQLTMSRKLGRRPLRMQNRVPLVSFTFDDFPRSALHTAGAMLKAKQFRGTYYTALGLMGREAPVGRIFLREDLEAAVADGHELGCHTFHHCPAWQTPAGEFEKSILENQRSLRELLPQAVFSTHSYPISDPNPRSKRRAEKYYACCRGGGQVINSGDIDLNCLSSFFLEKCRESREAVASILQQNDRERGWLIFATHDVSDKPTRFGCTSNFFAEVVEQVVRSGARVLPVREACAEAVGAASPAPN